MKNLFDEELEDYKQRIFYFFGQGEFMETLEEDDEKSAIKRFFNTYKPHDFDLLMQYDKKTGEYKFTYNIKILKKFRRLIRRKK